MEQNTNDASRDRPLYSSICVFVVKYFHEVGHWFPVPPVPLLGDGGVGVKGPLEHI